MGNKIEQTVTNIALQKKDLKLPAEIYRKIIERLHTNRVQIGRWRSNNYQPSMSQFTQIVELLQEYDPKITLDTIWESKKSQSIEKANKIFKD